MSKYAIGFVLIVMLALFGCAHEGSHEHGDDHDHDHGHDAAAGLSNADRATIAASGTAWQDGALAGDWASVAAEYTDDAILMPPNAPAVTGKAAVLESLSAMPALTSCTLEHVEVEGAGDWAWVRGVYSMTWDGPDGPVTDTGKYLEIRQRQADGTWPLVRDIYNSDAPIGM